ncbi:MAG: F0F1 ATP synthase subunit B [Oscillospiraceae bacterium]|nr:F0F1 ATP synthase subunit B [Oscillospiraceae bacterium]
MYFLTDVPPSYVFGIELQTFISVGLTLINLAILAFVLTKLLYKPVLNFLQKRADRVQEQIERAETDSASAAALKLQYEEKLKAIDLQREEILEEARKQAVARSKQILAEAKSESDAVRNRAAKEIELEMERAKDEIRQAILEVSVIIAEKYIARAIDAELHEKLFASTMAELEEAPWQR